MLQGYNLTFILASYSKCLYKRWSESEHTAFQISLWSIKTECLGPKHGATITFKQIRQWHVSC